MLFDCLPEARVVGEAPAYAFRPGVGEPVAVVSDLGEHPGTELDAESGEAEDDLSVRGLGESLFQRLREAVGSPGSGLHLDQEGEHLRGRGAFDQGRLVSPLAAEDLA